jgi:hypothetical protein
MIYAKMTLQSKAVNLKRGMGSMVGGLGVICELSLSLILSLASSVFLRFSSQRGNQHF